MTRLVSGKVVKVPSANVSADRYQFLELAEAEPDLGLPPSNNYALSSDPQGNRKWIDLTTTLGNSDVAIGNVFAAGTLYGNNLIVRNIDILDALIGETTLANVIIAKQIFAANVTTDRITANIWEGIYTANVIESPENLYYSNDRVIANLNLASIDIFKDVADLSNIDFGQGLIWDGNAFAPVYISSDLANIADLAIRVTSLENFTTANVAEASSNLYFTNARAVAALAGANVLLNDLFVAGDLVVQGNSAILNVATLVVEDKNIILANGATSAGIADGAGISIQGADANITYRESGDKFELNKNLDVQGNIIAGSGTGGSITGANVITTDTLAADLLVTDTLVSNTIVNTAGITTETIFANLVANTIRTDSVNTSTVVSDSDLVLVAGAEVITFNSSGDLKLPNYVEFRANSYIGDEPGAGIPQLRIVAAAGKGLSLETDADISGNNNVATFDISGEFAVPKSLQANSLVSNLLSITGIAQVNGYDVLTKELTDATFEPMGHEDKANSIISFDSNTRTFSIQPVGNSYTVWVKGNKFVKTGTESVTLANVTDLYYIYFNTDGNIAVRSSYFDWENDTLTSYVYWNANTQTAPFFADERHGITLDWATHEYLHRTRGAVIAEGFSIGSYTLNNDGSSDANAQISIGNGTFFDEDLQVDVVHSNSPTPNTWEQDLQGPARIPMFYLEGTEWVRDEPTDFALKQGTARIKYNLLSGGQWTTPDVPTNGYFTTSWIIATNNLNYPILAIMGQTASETIGQEEEINFQDLTLTDFPVIEFRPLYKIIWSTNTGYANTPKAIISKIYDLRNIISASPSAAIASDHGLLSGLGDDDHAQYLHIENARTVTASHTFSGIQAFANITVSGSMVGNLTGQVSDITNHSVNSLVDVDITGIIAGQIIAWDGTKFVPGSADVALFSERANTAERATVANTVLSLEGLTTDDLNEGSANLYFSVPRARTAFSAGLGIAISANGVISAKGDDTGTGMFNSGINLLAGGYTDAEYSNAAIFSAADGASFILYSFHITNLSSEAAYLKGRYIVGDGEANTVLFANLLEIEGDSSQELLRKPQVFKPGDRIELQSFDKDGVATPNVLSTYISYQASTDELYNRVARTLSDNTAVFVFDSPGRASIIESLLLVNLSPNTVPVTTYLTNSNGDLTNYITSNLKVPPGSSIEVCEYPKAVPEDYKIKINKFGNPDDAVSVFITSKFTSFYSIQPSTGSLSEGSSVIFNVETLNLAGGTVLYYTTEVMAGNIDQSDFDTPIDGSVTINNDSASITVTANTDISSQFEGDEVFRLQLRKGSTSGVVVATSANVTIADTSNTVTFGVFESSSALYYDPTDPGV